jgi:cellulose synthase/poly-beta-1,6-N-acetylglucosamine synthase-like glycosyltransferase/exo-beta-1,3-glucanase (GH17 family)
MRILVALLVVCLGSALFWRSLDKPLSAPDWKGEIGGIAYSPSHFYTEDDKDNSLTDAMIRRDLEQLSQMTGRIRTYTVNHGHDRIPYIAKEFGLKVAIGIWLGGDEALNDAEIAKGLKVINDNPGTVDRVFVGNEVVGVRAELTVEELNAYLKKVREGITVKGVEIGTADVWGTFIREPGLVENADFVAIHLLPYWEGIALEKSMDYVTDSVALIENKFPGKKIIIGETGWPSHGRMKRGAVPSEAFEAAFLRQFFNLAAHKNYDYYIMEAYDQPWKGAAGQEGAVGAYWGMMDAEGQFKFSFTGELSSFSSWKKYAGAAVVATFMLGLIVLAALPKVSIRGYALVGSIVGLIVTGALLIIESSPVRYIDKGTLIASAIIVPAGMFTAILLLTETAEWALSLWRKKRLPDIGGSLGYFPRVSIHVPIHNEPPLMVMQTLNSLSRLDYPNFEVIVLDNNTSDETLWRPVAAHCEALGASKFRFYHYENMKGFKAGALNKALELTDPTVEYVGVIDSDYQVAPHWLKACLPGFADPNVAIVQAPQDYRDANESLFKSCLYEEYTGFFRIGMVERNEHNAIIQHGTMCIVRRSTLEQVGRWSEWCITEDTELGLRIFEAGYTALYTPQSMGRGLMPDTYSAYKGQRYRWVYGAMQIMKKHAKTIFGGHDPKYGKLTFAQRYQFFAGWMPWFADGFALVFGVLALIWSALMIIAPRHFDVPLTALSGVALALFTVKTIKTVWLHGAKVGTGVSGSIASALTGLSLSYTVGMGVIKGLFTSSMPFMRTPKCEDAASWQQTLQFAKTETMFLIATIVAIFGTMWSTQFDDPADYVWVAALSTMAIPYAAALVVSFFSTMKFGRPVLAPNMGTTPILSQSGNVDVAA